MKMAVRPVNVTSVLRRNARSIVKMDSRRTNMDVIFANVKNVPSCNA